MSVSLATIEAAIRTWVTTSSGLASTNVIWAHDGGPRPVAPYIELRGDLMPVGWDAVYTEDAAAPSPGAEITYRVLGMRELNLELQAFGGPAAGNSAGKALLDAVMTSTQLPSIREALAAVNYAPARWSRIQTLGDARGGSVFEPRAIMTIDGFVSSELTEDGTYIQIVSGENQIVSPAEAFSWDSGA